MKQPTFSVIIPVKEVGSYSLDEGLPGLQKLTYPHFEVLLLPNDSTKNDQILLKKYPWLRIIPTRKITRPAQKRNIGARVAKGEIIAFIDDDAYPSPQWLEKAAKLFQEKKIEAVCGPGVLPKKTNDWERVFDVLLKSPIGSGGFAYRFTPEKERYVDDYPSMNFLIKKKIFLDLGGFDNDFWPGEDSKLCEELVNRKNGKILYHPDVLIYHHRRNNLLDFLKQHSQYGFHRGAFFAHGDKNSRRFSYFVPALFVLYLAFVVIINIVVPPIVTFILFPFLMAPLQLYLLFIMIQAVLFMINTKDVVLSTRAIITLMMTHIVYGIFFIKGLYVGWQKKDKIY
ncbi:MAG: glycosyltransferase [Candidatus Roizmanbacteria bacterium]|nr:glycosyltransferase [Candidatus Roizmanbacteria bacterium]